jgi:hypothetical protein
LATPFFLIGVFDSRTQIAGGKLTVFLIILVILIAIALIILLNNIKFTSWRKNGNLHWRLAYLGYAVSDTGASLWGKRLRKKKKKREKKEADDKEKQKKDTKSSEPEKNATANKKKSEEKEDKDNLTFSQNIELANYIYKNRQLGFDIIRVIYIFFKTIFGNIRLTDKWLYVRYGLGDPYYTGITSGFLYSLNWVEVEPVFTEPTLDLKWRFTAQLRMWFIFLAIAKLLILVPKIRTYRAYKHIDRITETKNNSKDEEPNNENE